MELHHVCCVHKHLVKTTAGAGVTVVASQALILAASHSEYDTPPVLGFDSGVNKTISGSGAHIPLTPEHELLPNSSAKPGPAFGEDQR